MKRRTSSVQVWLDADISGGQQLVGVLYHDAGQVRFEYNRDWLRKPFAFALDPDLSLDRAAFFPRPEASNFGIFLDSSPDRWGQILMSRRELIEAKDEQRPAQTMYAWDYLLGVQDETRQGALRFRTDVGSGFIAEHGFAAPPVTSLRELAAIAYSLSAKNINDLDKLRKWLAVLVAPGASLGGARPKANFREPDGSLWIAKFPAQHDSRDAGAWEGILHCLAERAGIDVAKAHIHQLGNEYHTFCTQRFDRRGADRIFFSSAMTVLRKSDGGHGSYLELAEFIQRHGTKAEIEKDLAQLFLRVVFNIATGNRDDHLRNHGFLMTNAGWRLSPAFDMNPSIEKDEHVLAIDDADRRPDIATALSTAALYRLSDSQATAIVDKVGDVIKGWRELAQKRRIARFDIEQMAAAFSAFKT